jgi:hypothetical protein
MSLWRFNLLSFAAGYGVIALLGAGAVALVWLVLR